MRSRKDFRFVKRIDLDLGVSRTKELIEVSGDSIRVESIDGEADLYFNEEETDYIQLDKTRKTYMDFWRIFITNAAQAGKTCSLLIGRLGAFDSSMDIPEIDYMVQSGIIHAEDNTQVDNGGAAYVLFKTIHVLLPETSPITSIIASGWKDAAQSAVLKVTTKVDAGGEITRIEQELPINELPYYATGLNLYGEVTVRVYLKSEFTTAHNKTCKLVGDIKSTVVYV